MLVKMRSKNNFHLVSNPTNLKLRYTFAKCRLCEGIIPRNSHYTYCHGKVITEEIEFCAVFWSANNMLICSECFSCIPGAIYRDIVRLYNHSLNEDVIRRLR